MALHECGAMASNEEDVTPARALVSACTTDDSSLHPCMVEVPRTDAADLSVATDVAQSMTTGAGTISGAAAGDEAPSAAGEVDIASACTCRLKTRTRAIGSRSCQPEKETQPRQLRTFSWARKLVLGSSVIGQATAQERDNFLPLPTPRPASTCPTPQHFAATFRQRRNNIPSCSPETVDEELLSPLAHGRKWRPCAPMCLFAGLCMIATPFEPPKKSETEPISAMLQVRTVTAGRKLPH
jgi:hypothetical protein